MKIVKNPKNGRLTKVGKFGLRFVPASNFTGSDYAEWDIIVRRAGKSRIKSVRIKMAITVK